MSWKVSLHSGHSWPYCDHAHDSLEDILSRAVEFGYETYGVTEHVPRHAARYLYPGEVEMGWTVETLIEKFDEYFEVLAGLTEKFAGEMTILRGFEAEVVPPGEYADIMRHYREKYDADYIVGSVHHVGDHLIDGLPEWFEPALEECGGLEPLCIAYYERVAEMVAALEPEVVGHLDLVRKNGRHYGTVDTPSIRSAARTAVQEIRRHGAIIDVNVAAYRKGMDVPYPAPWLLQECAREGIPFCFGDDSHAIGDVGAGLEQGAAYLREHGIGSIRVITRRDGALITEDRALPDVGTADPAQRPVR